MVRGAGLDELQVATAGTALALLYGSMLLRLLL